MAVHALCPFSISAFEPARREARRIAPVSYDAVNLAIRPENVIAGSCPAKQAIDKTLIVEGKASSRQKGHMDKN
jgi:hypothetical protein